MLTRKIDQHSSGKGIAWFEVVGHTRPAKPEAPQGITSYLYEYGWTLGYHLAAPPKRFAALLERIESGIPEPAKSLIGRRSAQPAALSPTVSSAHVRLFFPTVADWLIIAHAATVKNLSPVEKEEQWRQRLAADWNDLAPVLGVAGQVTADVSGLAPIGAVAKAVAGLRATSVPQGPGANWFVRSIDIVHKNVLYQGVEWELPRELLDDVGTRISGSLLVSFTASMTSGDGDQNKIAGSAPPILANVTLSSEEGEEIDHLPKLPFLELDITEQAEAGESGAVARSAASTNDPPSGDALNSEM